MFGLDIVGLVIGLAFIYFLLSIVASAALELIAQLFSLRSRNLKSGIERLLADESAEALATEVYDHPLVSALDRPSYLQDTRFADALIDRVSQYAESGSTAAEILANGIEAMPSGQVRRQLQAITRDTTQSLDVMRLSIAKWFDESMDRWSGVYKRRSQAIIFAIGVIIAVGFNVDTFTIATSLHDNPAAREVIVAKAGATAQDPADALSVQDALDELEGLPIMLGWSAPQFCSEPERAANASCDLDRIGVFGERVVGHLPGWIITALAITLGAPFWFDTLSRLSQLRATGVKPRPTPSSGDASRGDA